MATKSVKLSKIDFINCMVPLYVYRDAVTQSEKNRSSEQLLSKMKEYLKKKIDLAR